MGLSEDEPQSFVPQPGNFDIRLVELDGNQQWVVRSLLEPHHDLALTDRHAGRGVDEVAEQVAGLRRLVTVADPHGQKAVETARHQRQLQVAVDLQRDCRGERIHVEEVDAVLDVVLDQHSLRSGRSGAKPNGSIGWSTTGSDLHAQGRRWSTVGSGLRNR